MNSFSFFALFPFLPLLSSLRLSFSLSHGAYGVANRGCRFRRLFGMAVGRGAGHGCGARMMEYAGMMEPTVRRLITTQVYIITGTKGVW
ncbi:hypothetical protein EDB81DRAFT_790289 [Dactylonectria macrodidyma]|uniref:Secreted protein n=1 Tax=Dactylonectria macrodidyma TaxID=307937 RepID=A0A9P9F216_9HYPO|nr:hypothetical protein EDB81DRAFT_790289 [Dactylonectria macrodidyma]